MSWEQIAPAIREKAYHRPQTALVALENTHNMAGGTVYPTPLAQEICAKAHEAGLKVHLDGARVFNAATHLGRKRRRRSPGISTPCSFVSARGSARRWAR